jgi:hypothetical protein
MVDMIDKSDGIRRVGCELCDVWSVNTLTSTGAIMNLRLKMGINPAPDEDYTPDENDINDMDEFMAGYEDDGIEE